MTATLDRPATFALCARYGCAYTVAGSPEYVAKRFSQHLKESHGLAGSASAHD